eukprot:11030620-Ditylum_brightwellii.AAC.1
MIGRQKERADKRREDAKKRGDGEGDERAVSTLYVGFMQNDGTASSTVTETDIRDKFYSFGEITS